MRIAQIAPLMEAVPPKLYGGTERIVAYLTDELVAMGHEVSLFASGDSVTAARLEAAYPQALRLDPTIRDHVAPLIAMLETVAQRAHELGARLAGLELGRLHDHVVVGQRLPLLEAHRGQPSAGSPSMLTAFFSAM